MRGVSQERMSEAKVHPDGNEGHLPIKGKLPTCNDMGCGVALGPSRGW